MKGILFTAISYYTLQKEELQDSRVLELVMSIPIPFSKDTFNPK